MALFQQEKSMRKKEKRVRREKRQKEREKLGDKVASYLEQLVLGMAVVQAVISSVSVGSPKRGP